MAGRAPHSTTDGKGGSEPAPGRDTPSLDQVPAKVLGGRFQVDRVLGKGGMGSVLAATDLKSGRRVALKLMRSALTGDAGAIERFRREALVLRAIDHPAIVGVEDAGAFDDGTLYLALELLEGRTLAEAIAEQGSIAPSLLVPIVRGLGEALNAVHRRGVVHRDVKPSNIFLPAPREVERASMEGEVVAVKLVDFGAAKVLGLSPLTATGLAVGTSRYMAPEQLSDELHLDGRVDIYSLGVVMYEALAGTHPFFRCADGEIPVAVLAGRYEPLGAVRDDLGSAVEAVVAKAMARDRAKRFETTLELADTFACAVRPTANRFQSAGRRANFPVDRDASTRPVPVVPVDATAEPASAGLAATSFLPRRWNWPAIGMAAFVVLAGLAFAWALR